MVEGKWANVLFDLNLSIWLRNDRVLKKPASDIAHNVWPHNDPRLMECSKADGKTSQSNRSKEWVDMLDWSAEPIWLQNDHYSDRSHNFSNQQR
jgi:hypothetical protein